MKDIDCLIMAALKTDLAKEKYVLYRLRKDWALIVWGGGSPSFPALTAFSTQPCLFIRITLVGPIIS